MTAYWRKRPVSEGIQYDGNIETLQTWLAAYVDPEVHVILQNVRAEEFEGGFRVLWDEGYIGAETMEARGQVGDHILIESSWIKAFTDADLNAQFEPVV